MCPLIQLFSYICKDLSEEDVALKFCYSLLPQCVQTFTEKKKNLDYTDIVETYTTYQ